MSPGYHLLLFLAAFLPLVGNLVGPTLPETVTVTEGEMAVLHYDFSAFASSQSTKKDLWISCSNFNGVSRVHVCDFYKGKSHALDDFSSRAQISRPNNTNHLYRLTINQTRFSDKGDYTCAIFRGSPGDSRTVHLAIKGRVENRELPEGADLTIDLSLSSCYIEFYGTLQNVTVCRVENGQVIKAAEEYRQRLSMQNGTLILSNLAAKDHGNYTVWDQSEQRAILTLTLEIISKPLGVQTTGRVENHELREGADLTIDLSLSSCYIEVSRKQQNVTVCRVENGQVIEAADEYCQRFRMQNRTLILSKLTAKDHGNYTVWDHSGQRAIPTLTLAVEIKTIPFGDQTTNPWIIGIVVAVASLVVILLAGYVIYKWRAKRKIKEDAVKKCEAYEMGSLNKSDSPADIGRNIELRPTQPLHDRGSIEAGSLAAHPLTSNQKWNRKNDRDCY